MKPVICVLVSLYSAMALPAGDTSTIDIRLTDHKPGIADFKQLQVSLSTVSLHKQGSKRSEGWVDILGNTALVDIVPVKDGRFVSIGAIVLPAEPYDAVRIEFSNTQSELLSGIETAVDTTDTIVANPIDLVAHEQLALVIDLFAENQTDNDPKRYMVKVKEIRINEQIRRNVK